MSKLVDELRKEHSVIVETFNKVKILSIGSEEGQNTLLAAKNGLLAHLKKEDEQLYPFLKNAAENDAYLKRTLDWFARDTDEISKATIEFFDKYSKGSLGLEFAKDVGRLFATLSIRIRKEEDIIYAEYDKLKQ